MAVLSQGRAGGWVPWCGAPLRSQPPLALWHQSRGVWRCRFLGAVLCNLQIIESAQKRLPEAPGSGLAGTGSDKPSGLKMSASALADLPRSAGNCHFLCSCKGEQAAHFVKDKNFFSPLLAYRASLSRPGPVESPWPVGKIPASVEVQAKQESAPRWPPLSKQDGQRVAQQGPHGQRGQLGSCLLKCGTL